MRETTQLHPHRFIRYPDNTGSSQTGFDMTGELQSNPLSNGSFLSVLLPFDLRGARGFKAMFGATSSAGDNDAFDYRIWGWSFTHGPDGRSITGVALTFLGSGTATLGTGAFIGAVSAGATGRMADTLTWTPSSGATTPKGPMTDLELALGSGGSRAFSPANNLAPALLIVPDAGHELIMIEFDSTTGDPLGMFALIERLP